jgi:sulfur-carrier protein
VLRIVYFASVREAVGCDGEERDLPADVATVSACLDWLEAQGAQYEAAFANRSKLRFALDQKMVNSDAPLTDTSELAIFPPVTGG